MDTVVFWGTVVAVAIYIGIVTYSYWRMYVIRRKTRELDERTIHIDESTRQAIAQAIAGTRIIDPVSGEVVLSPFDVARQLAKQPAAENVDSGNKK